MKRSRTTPGRDAAEHRDPDKLTAQPQCDRGFRTRHTLRETYRARLLRDRRHPVCCDFGPHYFGIAFRSIICTSFKLLVYWFRLLLIAAAFNLAFYWSPARVLERMVS